METRADYGYDAPYVLIAFALLGTLATAASIIAWARERAVVALALAPYGAFFLGNALSFFYTTRHGKFRVWRTILDGLRLSGDERVLDLGCGRGAVFVAVAHRSRRTTLLTASKPMAC